MPNLSAPCIAVQKEERPAPDDLLPAPTKCCAKCAFRSGSPERADPYGWMRLVESWTQDGGVFACHQSVPGHPQEQQDGSPRWRLCRGFTATRHRADAVMKLAMPHD